MSTKSYDKRDDFDFEIVNSPLNGDVPRSTSYGVYISHSIRFADFNSHYKKLTQKPLKQGYQYHKIRKTFFFQNFTTDTMISNLTSLLDSNLSCAGGFRNQNLMATIYKLKKIAGSINLQQSLLIFFNYKKMGYNINELQQAAHLVVSPITVGNFAFLFNCTLAGRTSDPMTVLT